jgi:hypothetical protein
VTGVSGDFPAQIVDANGDTWEPAAGPGRYGEPVYYPTTGPESWALTPTEIRAQYGIRSTT